MPPGLEESSAYHAGWGDSRHTSVPGSMRIMDLPQGSVTEGRQVPKNARGQPHCAKLAYEKLTFSHSV